MKKKIVHVVNFMGSGGVEKFLIDFCERIDKEKYETDILIVSRQQEVYNSNFFPNDVKVINLTAKKVFSIRCIIEIFMFFINNKYDIIHTHLFPVQMYIPLLVSNKKTKLITTEHGISERRKNYKFFHFIEKIAFSRYDKIIGVSEIVSTELAGEYPELNNIMAINNGIDIERFSKAEKINLKEINIDKNDVIISMVGRLEKGKDQETLIKAMKKLPNNFKLLLVGRGYREEELKGLVKELSLDNRVLFLGFRSDVEKIYKLSSINVLSTKKEGLPLVVLESLATGSAFLGSNVDGVKQLVPENMLFDYHNEEMLADKIKELIYYPEKYEIQRRQAKVMLENYDIKDMIKKYEVVYDE